MTTYIVGASVTRLSVPMIRTRLPKAVINAVDGRSMIHPDVLGGPTVMEVIRGWLPKFRAGDVLVVEAAHGGVDVLTNERYMHEVLRLCRDDMCVAWIIPCTFYDHKTPEMVLWNSEMEHMIRPMLDYQPLHAAVEWGPKVESLWREPHGQPLVYDGRHPTDPAGTWWYAKLIYDALQSVKEDEQ